MRTNICRGLVLLSTVLSLGCGRERDDFRDCSGVDSSLAGELPTQLSETGLYSDISDDVISAGAIAFTPRFPLWTDGATKRRWLLLPEGEPVDTSDPEDWVFPVGTRTFKEFTRDGVRVETRLNLKTADGWAAASYLWNEAQSDALRTLQAARDVGGTRHDVPSAAECAACHGGRGDFTLGFSATQLDVDVRTDLFEDGVFSVPVEAVLELEPQAAEGLGYLHGNCSHCHNPTRDRQPQSADCYAPGEHHDFDLTLPPDLETADAAPAVRTARQQLGSPRDSKVLDRMSTRERDDERPAMPPLGTERIDEDGIAAVRAFLATL